MKLRNLGKEIVLSGVLLALVLITFLVSLICYESNRSGLRRTFIFPSADEGKYVIEYRNLSKNAVQGDIQYFIDELLLGSSLERTKMLFKAGTAVESCFERKGVLYLNLSDKLLEMGNGVVDIKDGVKLLEDNVKRNFPRIDSIELFIGGKYAFES